MDFLKDIVKEIGDDYIQLAEDISEDEQYIDTGSFIFNGLVCGSIFGGVSSKRITASPLDIGSIRDQQHPLKHPE